MATSAEHMQSTRASSRLWPVLVADLADPAGKDFLAGVALAGGRAFLPLIAAPATVSTHVLEVYSPDTTEPLVLFAEPLGAPTIAGFPLQLRMYDATEEAAPVRSTAERRSVRRAAAETETELETPAPAADLRARVPTSMTLTESHTRELTGELEPAEPAALLGRTLAGGKLLLEGVIGAGGVGSVYRAAHRDLRIPVAVKVLHHRFQQDLDFCRRFHSEALAASRLDHPNLVRVLDFGQEPDGLLYLAMEHIDGRCLADVLEPGRALPLARIVDLMMQITAGLAHAHSRGIVHRDIKPENVMLVANADDDERPEELVKVCDFGIAQQADVVASTGVVGTPNYMSPEQCRGAALDGQSDVYSCGVLLYELATGQMPFSGPTTQELLKQHMFVDPVPPRLVTPEIDAQLESLIMRCLEKEPSRRPGSMRALRRELRALLDVPVAPSTPTPAPAVPRAESGEPGAPEWLERGGSYRHDSSGEMRVANVNAVVLAAELVARPAAWLSAFAATSRADAFGVLASRLEGALPILFAEQQTKALFAVRCTLDELTGGAPPQLGWRVARARELQHMFAAPTLLAGLAESALAEDEPAREITELVLRIGGPAAYALYSARLKMSDRKGVPRRFVLLVRELGANALPMIRAGLARLLTKRDVAVASALAADLLQASPRVRDEEAGDLAARYVQGSGPALTTVAAEALVAFWGARATPLLLGLLSSGDAAVVVAAMDGLRNLQAIDQHVVARIALAAQVMRSAEVRVAARAALMETSGSVRGVAMVAVQRLLAESA